MDRMIPSHAILIAAAAGDADGATATMYFLIAAFILGFYIFVFWRRATFSRTLALFIAAYILWFVTAIPLVGAIFGGREGTGLLQYKVLTYLFAPLFCIMLELIRRYQNSSSFPGSRTPTPPNVAPPVTSRSTEAGWGPAIVAALIQAIAALAVAFMSQK
jgi:hypothetical protein